MMIFGIDPGSNATGFAVVSRSRGRYRLHHHGVVRTRSSQPVPERLAIIHAGLAEALAQSCPDQVAIEAIFRYRSSESALRLGQARGVALLAAAQQDLQVHEYNPMTVKKTIAGHGRADKGQVARLVSVLLGLDKALPSDASDAAAIAMTHLVQFPLQQRARELELRTRGAG
ncbi:MAG: crossover junction endodeoxyribonuclease RuvC [Myxococcota bacterium]|jgi:crossover junction endodeoxyribonuclease RuvC|nr:crossover junction endodeoxyribonuclease RuvC [Myxococcota bacterium]